MIEGKKRQIRKVGSRIGLPVSQIKRVRIGNLRLGNLKSGEWRNLNKREVYQLRFYAGLIKDETK
jgi:16S rRNA U516 pseudouridylate synthase RsuA-like enzyme